MGECVAVSHFLDPSKMIFFLFFLLDRRKVLNFDCPIHFFLVGFAIKNIGLLHRNIFAFLRKKRQRNSFHHVKITNFLKLWYLMSLRMSRLYFMKKS